MSMVPQDQPSELDEFLYKILLKLAVQEKTNNTDDEKEEVWQEAKAAIKAEIAQQVAAARVKMLRRTLQHEKDVWGASRNESWIKAEIAALKKGQTDGK